MKDQDWWWRLRREFKKTDPANVMRFSDKKMVKAQKSIMDAISKDPAPWVKQTPSPNP